MLLIVEETVVLIDDLPQRFEVSLCRIGVFLLVDTGCQGEQWYETPDGYEFLYELSHGRTLIGKWRTMPIITRWA